MTPPGNFWMEQTKREHVKYIAEGYILFSIQLCVIVSICRSIASSLCSRWYGPYHKCFLSKIVCPSVTSLASRFLAVLTLLNTHTFFGRSYLLVSLKAPSAWRESIRKEIIYWSHGAGCLFPLIQCRCKQPIAHLIEYISSRCLQRMIEFLAFYF